MGSSENIRIDTVDATVSGAFSRPADAFATIVLAPGAGADFDHPFMVGFTHAMNDEGVATLRFNFPYREAGRRFPDRPPAAIATWRAAMDAATARSEGVPVWAGGKSFGGRMASMAVADGMPVAGLIFLGYPLHPPGRPEALRDEHLYAIDVPMLFLQGARDPFATGNLLDTVVEKIGSSATLQWLADADHSFDVKGAKRKPAEVGASLAPAVVAFLRGHSPKS